MNLPVALTALAEKINAEHAIAEEHARTAVQHAIRCGELLTEAKTQVAHGQWLPWLEANFVGSDRTASAYMRLAANRQHVADLSSVREALEHLSEPKRTVVTFDEWCAMYERMENAIKEAHEHDEVQEALDAGRITKNEAMVLYAKIMNDTGMEKDLIAIRLKVTRWLGQLIKETGAT